MIARQSSKNLHNKPSDSFSNSGRWWHFRVLSRIGCRHAFPMAWFTCGPESFQHNFPVVVHECFVAFSEQGNWCMSLHGVMAVLQTKATYARYLIGVLDSFPNQGNLCMSPNWGLVVFPNQGNLCMSSSFPKSHERTKRSDFPVGLTS